AMRRYLLLLTQSLALVTFPLTFGLALVADDFVNVVLGAKWSGAILPLQLLALYASFRSVTPLLAPILHATGEQRYAARNSLVAALVLPIGFFFGSRWGTAGIAATWIVLHPPVVWLVYRKVAQRIELKFAAYLLALRPAMIGSIAMAAAVLVARFTLHPVDRHFALAAEIATGALVYAGYLLAFESERIAAGRRLLASIRGRSADPVPVAPSAPPVSA
ncbi:MAG: polysaccharide biosynthesis C-terminal domain-containing protein, partial [Longimicrobiales bacterium]